MWNFLEEVLRQRLRWARPRLLLDLDNHNIPDRLGVYLFATDGQTFPYPHGESRLFYFGGTENLNSRLNHHLYRLSDRLDDEETLHTARYEYAAAFGIRYNYLLAHGTGLSHASLERRVRTEFTQKYWAPPVADGAPRL